MIYNIGAPRGVFLDSELTQKRQHPQNGVPELRLRNRELFKPLPVDFTFLLSTARR